MATATLPLEKAVKKASLRYISHTESGICRRGAGKGFIYHTPTGKPIRDNAIVKRIDQLAIPPAWEKVWICPSPKGYLQAIGYDERGRAQYIYHEDWTRLCQENKFNTIANFGALLPKIRRAVDKDLADREHSREKILATVVWLLEHTFIRIGNEGYAKENDSFGLTTLRNRHVKIKGQNIQFTFRGKSGIEHSVDVAHPRIAKIIKDCVELPGYEIFNYLDENNERKRVDASDVNEYLKTLTGEDISAKDFRTWGGTVVAAKTFHELGPAKNETAAKRNINLVAVKVSQHLRNTPTVCKKYYIHPSVVQTYRDNILIPHIVSHLAHAKSPHRLSPYEFAVIRLLKKYPYDSKKD